MLAFLEVPWDPEVLQFHTQARQRFVNTPSFEAVTQPVHKCAAGRWHRYRKQVDAVMPLLVPSIDALGYGAAEEPA